MSLMRSRADGSLSEPGVLAVAAAACAGALVAHPLPWMVGAVAFVSALALRRQMLLVVSVFLLATSLGARSWAGISAPEAGRYRGPATLLTDPVSFDAQRPAESAQSAPSGRPTHAVRAVVRLDGSRLDVWAGGSAARRLAVRQAGDQLWVEGRIRPASPGRARRLALRHIEGTITLERVIDWAPGSPLAQSANRVRGLLTTGARVLDPVDRSLYLGLVMGDDREQPRDLVDTFRRSGLGHLSAVSGQNVAFVLAAVSPLLRRCRPLPRWALTMGFLVWFAVLTRLEPSVLRATVMAGLAATTFALGRSASPLRLLCITVSALLLVDPLLVHSVGFWMSASATLGIVLWSGAVAAALSPLRLAAVPVAVSLSAQVGVAPVAWWVFGREATWSLPANLLAGPCAAVVMTVGAPAGVIAALVPTPVAALLHGPTLVSLRALRAIAEVAARFDAVSVRPLATLGGLATVAWALRRQHRRPPVAPGGAPDNSGAGKFAP